MAGGSIDRALLAAHAHDHLEADLLELDLAALRERERHAQRGPAVVGHELLLDLAVETLGRIALPEDRAGQPVEHLGAHHLAVEEGRLEDRQRRERRADQVELLALGLAPGGEVALGRIGQQRG